jgi:C1A family cysteine protease
MGLALSKIGRRYGLLPSGYDPRDLKLAAAPLMPSAGDPVVDLSSWLGPVKDQGQLGACTAFADTGNREYLARRFEHTTPIFSPLFTYALERLRDGVPLSQDSGSTARTACWVMNHQGACLESDYPYNSANFASAPTPALLAEALNYRAGAYHLLQSIDDVISCLASGYPVLYGFNVYDSFESDAVASSGLVPMPQAGESLLGGHETLIFKKDDPARMFTVRNEWGPNWGQGGNFLLPYDVFNALVIDCWMQHLGPAWKPQ